MSSEQEYIAVSDKQNLDGIKNLGEHHHSKKSKLIFISIFTILAFVIEYLIREPFTDLSEYIQEHLTFAYKCEIGDLFVWFKYQGKTFIFLFVYNISNVYVSMSMILLDAFGIFINGTLKLIYIDPRPFWRNENLVPCGCATNYGSPSTTSLDVYLVCAVVYRALIKRHSNTLWKVMVWAFFLLPQILAWTSRFIQNIHSLPQLVFGLVIGYIIQYIYFEILEVNMEDIEQLKGLVNTKSFLITLSSALLGWAFFNGIHYYFINIEYNQTYLDNIKRHCQISTFDLFDNESYQKTSKAFLFIGSIIGIYIEYGLHFNFNFEEFADYNMREEKWVKTPGWKVAIRIFLMIIISKLVNPFIKFGSRRHDSLAYLNLGRCIVKMFVNGLFYFWIFKLIFRVLCLTNEKSRLVSRNQELKDKLIDPALPGN